MNISDDGSVIENIWVEVCIVFSLVDWLSLEVDCDGVASSIDTIKDVSSIAAFELEVDSE